MLLRAAAPRTQQPMVLAMRPFSSSHSFLSDNRKPSDRSAPPRPRSNPLVGNYVPAKPARPEPLEPAPVSTEKPVSSRPPHPSRAPTSSAEVPPNADLPPPPPPRQSPSASSTSLFGTPQKSTPSSNESGGAQQHPYNAGAGSSNILDLSRILENSAAAYARSTGLDADPQSQKLARSAAVTGRTIFVGGAQRRGATSAPTPAIAFDMLNKVVVRRQGLKRKFNEQRRHERPGLKRKRLVMTRWRKRFREGFNAAVTRVEELRKQGW
jgi:small subunit ribosomal protein MRP21